MVDGGKTRLRPEWLRFGAALSHKHTVYLSSQCLPRLLTHSLTPSLSCETTSTTKPLPLSLSLVLYWLVLHAISNMTQLGWGPVPQQERRFQP